MDDLIYSFLLQADYPRASIVFDVDLLGTTAQISSSLTPPTFVIVDTDTAEPLAVINVVDALEPDALKDVATETGAYASRLAGRLIQGFVIRVDVRGQTEAEQVQFFRIWPNSTMQRLSTKSFPDLEALKVGRKLVLNSTAMAIESVQPIGGPLAGDDSADATINASARASTSAGLYVPALVLLVLIVVDGMFITLKGQSFLNVAQSILALGAAGLLTVPAAIRYLRH